MSELDISLIDQWRSKSFQKWTPMQASLELTNRCNERCSHCYIPKFIDDPQRTLNLEQWEIVLQKLRSAGTLYLILMGGEAMLNPHFWGVLKKAVDLGFHVSMISNGLKISSPEIANRLAENFMSNITFSLYSAQPEIHDRMTRVKGSWLKTIRAIEYCRTEGIDVTINSLLTSENISGIFELESWCLEKNLVLKVDPMVTPKLDGNLLPTKLRASAEQLKLFYQERARRWPSSIPKAIKESDTDYVCNAAKGKCAVTAYGELLPCIEIREPLGDLVNQDFTEIWASSTATKWRNFLVGDLNGRAKDETKDFCDHCPGMAKNEDGDPKKISSYAKQLAEIKYQVRRESYRESNESSL